MSELNKAEKYVIENILELFENGTVDENPDALYKDGNPANTLFITQVVEKYDIAKGEFPITELRPIAYKSAIREIEWIYKEASNDLKLLNEKYKIKWWNDFNIGDETIGDRYGKTVKDYNLVTNVLEDLKKHPFKRRAIINLWQEEHLQNSAGLPPCAFLSMFSVSKRGESDDLYLDLTLVQRSNDYATASHINKIQYVALLMMFSKHLGYKSGKFMHVIQNLHIYSYHLENTKELLDRTKILKQREKQSQPKLVLNVPNGTSFYDISCDDFELVDYKPILPQLSFELAINKN